MSGTEKRQRTTTTTFRLSPDERAAVVAAAAAEGLGPSSFARVVTLRAAGREAIPSRKQRDVLVAAMAPVHGQLLRHGNLLNQLARHAHIGGRVDPAALDALRIEVEALTRAVMAFRETAA
jgi:hypothetical protein